MTCILSCHWSLCVYLPFSPGRAPQSPPSNVYKRGGGLGGLLGFGWVGASKPQNPPAPYKHSLVASCRFTVTMNGDLVVASDQGRYSAVHCSSRSVRGAPVLPNGAVLFPCWLHVPAPKRGMPMNTDPQSCV